MYTQQEWKNGFLGCFEILLFMSSGVERFDSIASQAVKSFIMPLILLPLFLVVTVGMSAGYNFYLLLSLHSLRVIFTSIMFLTVVYFMSRQLGRDEHFFRFVTVNNWMSIPSFLMVLPILFGLLLGSNFSGFESYAIFITLAGYVYTAFIATRSFRLPWELGGFIGVVSMAIDQNALHLMVYLRDFLV